MVKDEFLQDFVDEAKVHIEEVEAAFLDTTTLKNNDTKINDVFRAMHSIKGTAGFFQLTSIVALSHAMENVLGNLRSKTLVLDNDVLDLLLECNDQLKKMILDISNVESYDINEKLTLLEEICRRKPASPPKDSTPAKEEEKPATVAVTKAKQKEAPKKQIKHPNLSTSTHINEKFFKQLKAKTKQGHKIYKLTFFYNEQLPNYYNNINQLFVLIAEIGVIVDVFADYFDSHKIEEVVEFLHTTKDTTGVEILFTTVLEPDLLFDALDLPQELFTHIKAEVLQKQIENFNLEEENQEQQSFNPSETVRVSVKLLDNLMALSGEMVLARNQLLTSYTNGNTDEASMNKAIKHLDVLTSQLQEQMTLTRMQPLGNVFHKFPRVIRDIAKSMNKDIVLTIEGQEIQLDKTMIENLADPLTHLVRNSADHGIESPKKRLALGKPSNGEIHLRAYHKGSMVAVEVSDNGTGLNVEAIKKKAVKNQLVSQSKVDSMSEDEIYQLILIPGFSTAECVSNISGRGVGMDIVKKNVKKMGGVVEISSKKDVGTTITLLLPKTLAIMKSLTVESSGQRFVIPQSSIVQVLSLDNIQNKNILTKVQNAYSLQLRGEIYPTLNLQEVLNLPPSQSPPTRVVIVNALKRKFGILVNKIYNTDETLSKPLPKYLKNSSFYSGVTIMGDGVISLILDTDGLIRKTHLGKESLNEPIPLYEKNKNIREKQSIILFQCSGEEIYGVDLNMVSRVETINASSIEKIGDSYFVNIKGKTLKVIRPENYLPVTKNEYKNEQLVVIIPNLITNPVSLVVGRIIDSVKAELELDTTQISAQGIWGTIFYNNRIVLMLNLYELSNLANPPATTAKLDVNLKGKNILIAEDTQFFQHVERKYLEDVGCNVTIAINGKEAWELLQTNQYDGVISDIIMPQLNGFELIKLIRNSPSLHHLPAIAVSSVSTEKHIQKALDYGFDAFENKLNKENLIKTFAHIIFNKKREVE